MYPVSGSLKLISPPSLPVVVAGSINGKERMQFVEDIGAWGFTMGSALFAKDFVKNGSFRDNLKAVLDIMSTIK